MRRKGDSQETVDAFNKAHCIGAAVVYRSSPGADPRETRTRSAAWLMGGHTAVVLVNGVSGGVALSSIADAPAPVF